MALYSKVSNAYVIQKDVKHKVDLVCDECGCKFSQIIKQLDYVENEKLVVEGFECPNCHKWYISTVTNNELRKGIIRARELANEYKYVDGCKEREYAEYLAKRGKIPTDIKERYNKKLTILYDKYKTQADTNRLTGQILKRNYISGMYK